MTESATLGVMPKKAFKTVPVHARLPEPDVAVLDRFAAEELISRSNLIARIVREWVKARGLPRRTRKS